MARNRKATESFILEHIAKIAPTDSHNVGLYKEFFKSLNDKQFDDWMMGLKRKDYYLAYYLPNFGKDDNGKEINIETQHLIKLCESIGVKLFDKLVMPAQDGKPAYVTQHEYPILLIPCRRQSQILSKKIAVPKSTKIVDQTSGQPVGGSKGGSTSYPEIGVLMAAGLEKTVNEIVNLRGGDVKGYQALFALAERDGSVSQDVATQFSGKVKSTQTLSMYLKGMHLNNNL